MNLKRQYMGDSMGTVDSDGIAQWYPNCKVRFDGSNYIATPHTTNTCKRTKRIEEKIIVSVKDGKFELKDNKAFNDKVIDRKEKSLPSENDEPKITTRKALFDELYDK